MSSHGPQALTVSAKRNRRRRENGLVMNQMTQQTDGGRNTSSGHVSDILLLKGPNSVA